MAAFLVVVVRTKEEQKVMMPYVIGKNYIEVHNELQRLQLKVRLETQRIPEKQMESFFRSPLIRVRKWKQDQNSISLSILDLIG